MKNRAKCDYTLEGLAKTFKEHALQNEKDTARAIKEHKRNYPQVPVPSYLLDEFNICEALGAMCQEILLIKKHQNNKTA